MKNKVKLIGIVIVIINIIFNVSCDNNTPNNTVDYTGIYSGNIKYGENENDGVTITKNTITGNTVVSGSIITIPNISIGQYHQMIDNSVPNPPRWAFIYSGNLKIGLHIHHGNIKRGYFRIGKAQAEIFKTQSSSSMNISDMDDNYNGYLWGHQ